MSVNSDDQPVAKLSKGRRFLFVSKGRFINIKGKKKYRAHSTQERRGSTSGAELLQVIEKVRKHPDYKGLDENQIKEGAEDLINPEYFRDYFSDFNEHHVEAVLSEVASEASVGLEMETHRHEPGAAAERALERMCEVQHISVKLQLSKLNVWHQGTVAKFASLVGAEYGPTRASLLIGNRERGYVLLEWNGTSLITPQHFSPESRDGIVFEAGVETEMSSASSEHQNEVRLAGEQLDYEKQIDLIFDSAVERSKVLDNLIEVVIKYNKYFYYHIFSRNCQHFVQDAMQAMKVQNPHSFTGKLKTYYDLLKRGNIKVNFQSHSELDEHVLRHLSEATHRELEYYMCIYLHFHAVACAQSSEQDPTKWKCEETSCQFDTVDARIIEQESVLSRFLQQ